MTEFKFMSKSELELMPEIDRMIRERECRWLTGISLSARTRMEKMGEFPQRLHLGGKAVGWRLSEVQAWIKGECPLKGSQAE